MKTQPESFTNLTGGIDRRVYGPRADRNTFRDLVNFRQRPSERGVVEQTPWFTESTLLSFPYYDSLNSPSYTSYDTTGSVTGFLPIGTTGGNLLYVGRHTVSKSLTTDQLQVFQQEPNTSVTAGSTLTSCCRVDIHNAALLGVTLRQTLRITIATGTTFTYSINGGAASAPVTISTAGSTLYFNRFTVYFLTNSGFNPGDYWDYRRTDAITAVGVASNESIGRRIEYVRTNRSTYFLGGNNRLFAVRGDDDCVVSAGYFPIHARHLCDFENHLVLAGAQSTAYTRFMSTSLFNINGLLLRWSDNQDIENFFSTDTNEADTKIIPGQLGICGLVVLAQRLFIFTADSVFYTDYLGLPLVFSFKFFAPLSVLSITGSLSVTGNNIASLPSQGGQYAYITTVSGVFQFNGNEFNPISRSIFNLLKATSDSGLYQLTIAYHDVLLGECYFYTAALDSSGFRYFFVYQERYDTWYRRVLPDSVNTLTRSGQTIIYGASRKIGTESLAGVGTLVTVDISPRITFHATIGDGFIYVKDVFKVYAQLGRLYGTGTFYFRLNNTRFDLNTLTDGHLDIPRINSRLVSFEITRSKDDGYGTGLLTLSGFEPINYSGGAER